MRHLTLTEFLFDVHYLFLRVKVPLLLSMSLRFLVQLQYPSVSPHTSVIRCAGVWTVEPSEARGFGTQCGIF